MSAARRGMAWALGLLVLLAVGMVQAKSLDDVEELRAAGEMARRMGRYDVALQAFAQAQAQAPRPEVAFALAETHHQRFLKQRGRVDLRAAIAGFRAFLALPGKPRVDLREQARLALSTLERLGDGDVDPAVDAAPVETWLVVRSPALAATVSVDGAAPQTLPAFLSLAPGRHVVAVQAEGWEKTTRWAELAEGRVHVLDAELRPVPAKLTVETTDEAQIYVDGRLVAVAPVEAPLEVEPGPTVVDVVLDGRYPFRRRMDLERGSDNELEADLERTPQRIGATFLLAAGGLGIGTAIGFGVAATLNVLQSTQTADPIEVIRLEGRAEALSGVSGMAAMVGLGLTLVGGIQFVFEDPPQGDESVAVRVVPGPGLGLGAELRF